MGSPHQATYRAGSVALYCIMHYASVLALLVTFGASLCASKDIKICSFNVQSFGTKKASQPSIMTMLAKIFTRYDVCLMQEIKDKSGEAMDALMKYIDQEVGRDKYGKEKYGIIKSRRIGKVGSSYQEQYAYIYKKKVLRPRKTAVYKEPIATMFDREPYAAKFRIRRKRTGVKEFALAGIHIAPKKAVKELNFMDEVYDWMVKYFNTKDAILMGDFNADCSYVTKKKFKTIGLWTDSRFKVQISDDGDTTVAKSDCAYDRFVTTGRLSEQSKSAQTYRYDIEHHLSEQQAEKISDHYPIEITLTV